MLSTILFKKLLHVLRSKVLIMKLECQALLFHFKGKKFVKILFFDMSTLWVDHILDWVVGSLTQFLQSYDKTELRKALTISSVRNFDISSSLKRPTNNKKFSLCKLCKAQENIHILWKQLQILKAYAEQWNICISYWYWFQKKSPKSQVQNIYGFCKVLQ